MPVALDGPVIGIRPDFDGVLPEGGEGRFWIVGIGPDLAPQSMRVRWTVNRVLTDYQWYSQDGQWRWEPVTTRDRLAMGEIALDGAGPAEIAVPVEWGSYEILVERTDGDWIAASTAFAAGWYAAADAGGSPDLLEASLDAERYAPGETATSRIVPRHAGTVLVSVLTDRVVAMEEVEVTAGETLIPLSVTEDWGAGAYVAATLLRPMDLAQGRNPARALGLAHAAVAPGDRALDVTIEAEEMVRPRGRASPPARARMSRWPPSISGS